MSRVLAKNQKSKAQWAPLVSFLSPCQSTVLDPQQDDPCPNSALLTLIPASTIEAVSVGALAGVFGETWNQEDEGLYVHRIELDLYIRPFFQNLTNAAQEFDLNFNQSTLLRVGLHKQRAQVDEQGNVDVLFWNPLNTNDAGDPGTLSTGDYYDGTYMRLWEHMFEGRRAFEEHFEPQGCCSEVTGGSGFTANGVTWTAVEGAINTAVSTNCALCNMGESFETTPGLGFGPFFNRSVQEPNGWNLKVVVPFKRRLHFKEADQLDLFFGWENISPNNSRKTQPALSVRGTGRALISR